VGSGGGLIREINHVHDDYFDSIFIGPLSHPKRPLDIVNAFSNLNNEIPNSRLHFVIGNTGIVSNRIKKEMVELANENDLEIFFYGSVSDERLYELYDLADIAVFVPESEPWGIFPLETLLGNIPTVISDQCGMKSVLPNNDLIVETGNIEEISNKILDIYKNYEDYKLKTSQIAKIVRAEYSWENYTKRMLECFNELI
jgi:glycosyltransferase involved in cell wall biosynthesis